MSKVVIVNYSQNDAFKIPKGINLEDETVVKEWWVKWNRLHINFVDGTTKVIHSEGWVEHRDYKYPSDDAVIEDAADYGIDDSEDEEEDEIQPHCFNMNMNVNVNCFNCDKIYCKSHSYCILGNDDMPYCSKECFLNC